MSCASLKFAAPLQSVDPDAVHGLSEGDELTVRLGTADGASVVEVVTAGGDYVGALIDRIADLLRCTQDGYEYIATVISVNGGDVRLRVGSPMIASGATYVDRRQEAGPIGSTRALMVSGPRAAGALPAVAGDLNLQTAIPPPRRGGAGSSSKWVGVSGPSRSASTAGRRCRRPRSPGRGSKAADATLDGETALASGMIGAEPRRT